MNDPEPNEVQRLDGLRNEIANVRHTNRVPRFANINNAYQLVQFLALINFILSNFSPLLESDFATMKTFTMSSDTDFFRLRTKHSRYQFHAYIFNVSNADQVSHGEKPIFQEIGPFVYKMQTKDSGNTGNHVDDALSSEFPTAKEYLFNVNESGGFCEEDELLVLFFMQLGIPNAMIKLNPDLLLSAMRIVDDAMKNTENLFVNATVRTILYDGIEEFMERTLYFDDPDETIFDENAICNDEETDVTENEETNYATNNTYHEYRCHNNNESRSNGLFLSQNLSYHFDSKIEVSGTTIHRYSTSMASEFNSESKSGCDYVYLDCCLDHAGYVLARHFNTVLFASSPHFHTSNSNYTIEGFKPDKEKHQMFIDLHPKTGQVMRFHYRVQYNLLRIQNSSVELWPLMWIDEFIFSSESQQENSYIISRGLLIIGTSLVVYFFQKCFPHRLSIN